MSKKYFKKENLRNQVADEVTHKFINFQPVGNDLGVIELDDEADVSKIASLNKLADQRIGGVVRVSPEIFDSLKKNTANLRPSSKPSFLNQIRVSPGPGAFGQRADAQPVAANSPTPAPPPQGIRVMESPTDLPPSSINSFRARFKPATPPAAPPPPAAQG